MTSWDEYMYASILLIQLQRNHSGWYAGLCRTVFCRLGLLMSAVVISLIPILIFFALVQKNLVQGLSAGAVKG